MDSKRGISNWGFSIGDFNWDLSSSPQSSVLSPPQSCSNLQQQQQQKQEELMDNGSSYRSIAKVIGVSQDDLGSSVVELGDSESLHGALGPNRHEHRGLHVSVAQSQQTCPRLGHTAPRNNLKFKWHFLEGEIQTDRYFKMVKIFLIHFLSTSSFLISSFV